MGYIDVIKRKKLYFLSGILLIAAFTWIYLINPAADLKKLDIEQVNIYSNSQYTLWDLGFNKGDLKETDFTEGEFNYNASFTDEALEDIKIALNSESRSYYLFGDRKLKKGYML